MKYTQLIRFKDSEYEVTSATTLEETKTVLAAGFEYVTEKDCVMLFGKPNRFINFEFENYILKGETTLPKALSVADILNCVSLMDKVLN